MKLTGGYIVNKEKIGIFIVERQELLREGLFALLQRESDMAVVGASDNGTEALSQISLLRVDVVLLDISIVYENCANIIRDLGRVHPALKIIALANDNGEEYVRATLMLGVAGYALKNDSHAELMMGVRTVMRGKTYLSSGISQFVVSAYLGQGVSDSNRRASFQDRRSSARDRRISNKVSSGTADALTLRERQIIKLIAEGRKNKEIAKTLLISPKTVEKHRANLMKKLDRHNTSQLTVFAMENGLLAAGFAA